jgi:hypothetical protein
LSREIYANKLPPLFDLFTYFAEKVGKSREKVTSRFPDAAAKDD